MKLVDHVICLKCSMFINSSNPDTLQQLTLEFILQNFSLCKIAVGPIAVPINRMVDTRINSLVSKKDWNLVKAKPNCISVNIRIIRLTEDAPVETPCTRSPSHSPNVTRKNGEIISINCCSSTRLLDL